MNPGFSAVYGNFASSCIEFGKERLVRLHKFGGALYLTSLIPLPLSSYSLSHGCGLSGVCTGYYVMPSLMMDVMPHLDGLDLPCMVRVVGILVWLTMYPQLNLKS